MTTIGVPLPYSCGRLTGYSNKLNDFYVKIPIRVSAFAVPFLAQLKCGILWL